MVKDWLLPPKGSRDFPPEVQILRKEIFEKITLDGRGFNKNAEICLCTHNDEDHEDVEVKKLFIPFTFKNFVYSIRYRCFSAARQSGKPNGYSSLHSITSIPKALRMTSLISVMFFATNSLSLDA